MGDGGLRYCIGSQEFQGIEVEGGIKGPKGNKLDVRLEFLINRTAHIRVMDRIRALSCNSLSAKAKAHP